MSITIPFSVEDSPKDCLIELRDLSGDVVITEIYHGFCEPGIHNVEFDPAKIQGGLEAGIYLLTVSMGGDSKSYPLQYMP
jgi:hypothetical protein